MNDGIHIGREGTTATLKVVGELELVQGDKLEASALRLLPETEHLTVDLSAVTFMDSSGLGALIAINQAADELGATVVLQDPPRSVVRVLEMTATADAFTITSATPGAPPLA